MGVRLLGVAVAVDKTGSETEGRLVGLIEMILICDVLEGSVLLSPNEA